MDHISLLHHNVCAYCLNIIWVERPNALPDNPNTWNFGFKSRCAQLAGPKKSCIAKRNYKGGKKINIIPRYYLLLWILYIAGIKPIFTLVKWSKFSYWIRQRINSKPSSKDLNRRVNRNLIYSSWTTIQSAILA